MKAVHPEMSSRSLEYAFRISAPFYVQSHLLVFTFSFERRSGHGLHDYVDDDVHDALLALN